MKHTFKNCFATVLKKAMGVSFFTVWILWSIAGPIVLYRDMQSPEIMGFVTFVFGILGSSFAVALILGAISELSQWVERNAK